MESLLEPVPEIQSQEITPAGLVLNYINKLEGWKTKCKNLHFASPKRNTHETLDKFGDDISEFQDSIAEDLMGITGKMRPNTLKSIPSDALTAPLLVTEMINGTIHFYDNLPKYTIYKGIASECENFIHKLNKYKYLFELCDNNNI